MAHKKSPGTPGRWNHSAVAQRYQVPEDVVRRIYSAIQAAKRQGLHAGYMVDLIERSVGRRLIGGEYTVANRARDHLKYDPESGYGGPKPRGSAAEPSREHDPGRVERAKQLVTGANMIISDVLRHAERSQKDLDLLRQAADELDVAADLYEESGPRFALRAGTLHMRARYARQGDYVHLNFYG